MHTFFRTFFVLSMIPVISGCRDSLVNAFAFYPQQISMNTQAPEGIDELFITAEDGTRLQALWFAQPGCQHVVLYLHGNAGHLYHRIPDAQALSATGSNVLLLSYRGYGKSGGSPSESGLYQDAKAAFNYLMNSRGFAERQIYILGRSIGSAIAIDVAQGRDLAGLVLLTPFSSGNDMAKSIGMGWVAWALDKPFDSVTKVSTLRIPALFVHGDADEIVPIALGQKLFAAYPGANKQFRVVNGAGHNDLIRVAGPKIWQWIAGFIQAHASDAAS